MAVNHKQFDAFASNFNLKQSDIQKLEADCVNELAARLLRSTVKATPVGNYPGTGKVGGTLRRGWTIKSPQIKGNSVEVMLVNPVEYASYVEYGHRTRGGQGWVEGRFMMTNAVDALRPKAQAIVDKKLERFLREKLNGK